MKPAKMNGKIIPDEQIETMLEMADWAPTHGRTEPWRFIVLDQLKAKHFCALHAELYRKKTDPEKFLTANYEKLKNQADLISHLIIVYAHMGMNPKIPEREEVAAVSAAIQNMLLYAASKGIAGFWSTGGQTYAPEMQQLIALEPFQKLQGLLFFGYTNEMPVGSRSVPISKKTRYALEMPQSDTD